MASVHRPFIPYLRAQPFVMYNQRKTFPEAVVVLAEKVGMSMDTP